MSVSYIPAPHERPYYEALFRVADTSGRGSLSGGEAVQFFARSKLPIEVLKNIWTVADQPSTSSLDLKKFAIAVRLIQLTQNGQKGQGPTLAVAEGVSLRPVFFEGVSGVSVPMPPAPAPGQQQQQQPPQQQQQHSQPPTPAQQRPPVQQQPAPAQQQQQQQQQQQNQDRRGIVPRTIEYGSVFAQAAAAEDEDNNNQDEDKTVTWDEDTFSKNEGACDGGGGDTLNDDDNGGHDEDPSFFSGGGGGSTGTSSSGEQALPSLTGAFQSLENRQIIMNCFLYLAIYMTIAVIAYSFVLERWSIIDSLYFAVATFTTCGYGDLEPTTVTGQIFTIFFAIYGVIILGVFIAIFGSFISEYQTKAMKKFQRKKQSQMMETLFKKPEEEDAVHNNNNNDNTTNEPPLKGGDDTSEMKQQQEEEEDDIQDSGFWKDHVSLADDVWRVVSAEAPLITLVAVMSLILGIREGWGITSTLYFCIMAATTTGYGDYTPTNQLDKLYCVILLPLAVAVFGEVLGRIASVYIQRKQRVSQFKFLHRSLTLCDIRNMDTNEDGKVDREDFVTFMLVALQKVDRSTIDELRSIFDSLDTNGNGLLEEDDLVELAEENYLPTVQRIREEYEELELDECLLRDLPQEPVVSPDMIQKHRRVHTVL